VTSEEQSLMVMQTREIWLQPQILPDLSVMSISNQGSCTSLVEAMVPTDSSNVW